MNAIDVKNVQLTYKFKESSSLLKKGNDKKKKKDHHALKGIDMTIENGKIIGLIGKNGSGKSTLLRTIAGIFNPDEGEIDLHGNSISLLAIGVGFKKELSGYDNIFLSGLLLGFSKKSIQEKLDEIIEFSELGDFIYRPVSSYSSGMYSKLAFSITSTLETDIMLIDEVFSVGDAKFKKKSYEKMLSLINDNNKTIVIVSHSLKTLKELCDEVYWIHEGEVRESGNPDTVIDHYEEFMQ